MLTKQLMYHSRRHMVTNPGERVHLVEAPLTLTFWLRASGNLATLMSRYEASGAALDAFCGRLMRDKLLIGKDETPPPHASYVRLESDADAASLGEDLLRRLCPPLLAPYGLSIKELHIIFGVYEKALCFPRRDAAIDYSYLQPVQDTEV